MSKRYIQSIADATRRTTDYVSLLLPIHLGGVYAYLSGSLLIGACVTAAFVSLICLNK